MKTLIGLVVVLVIVLSIIWYVRTDETFLSNILTSNEQSDEKLVEEDKEAVSPTKIQSSNDQIKICSPELISQSCSFVALEPVCSADTVILGKGEQTTRQTEYISACHYCKFYGADGVVDFGDEKVVSQGYSEGRCSQ